MKKTGGFATKHTIPRKWRHFTNRAQNEFSPIFYGNEIFARNAYSFM